MNNITSLRIRKYCVSLRSAIAAIHSNLTSAKLIQRSLKTKLTKKAWRKEKKGWTIHKEYAYKLLAQYTERLYQLDKHSLRRRLMKSKLLNSGKNRFRAN